MPIFSSATPHPKAKEGHEASKAAKAKAGKDKLSRVNEASESTPPLRTPSHDSFPPAYIAELSGTPVGSERELALLSASHSKWQPGLWAPSANFESIAIQIGRLAHCLNLCDGGDNRAQIVKEKLLKEEARTNSWARAHNLNAFSQVQSAVQELPVSIQNAAVEVSRLLHEWIAISNSTLRLERRYWFRTYGSTLDRIELLLESYELLESLRNVNSALESFDTPFFIPVSPEIPATILTRPMNIVQELLFGSMSSNTASEPQKSSNLKECSQNIAENLVPPTESQAAPAPIQEMFSSCMRGLHCAAGHALDNSAIHQARSRMLVWGFGLFSGPTRADVLLRKENDAVIEFKRHVMGTLADIAIILEHLLSRFDQSSDPEVGKTLTDLEASFGRAEEFGEEAFEDNPALLELQDTNNSDRTVFEAACLTQLKGSIDCLFDVLPSIDRLRQLSILELEKQGNSILGIFASASQVAIAERDSTPIATPFTWPAIQQEQISANLPKVQAIYAFNAAEPGKLSFKSGDVIQVIGRPFKNWWKGSLDGRVGDFPANYVRLISSEPLVTSFNTSTLRRNSASSQSGSPRKEESPKPYRRYSYDGAVEAWDVSTAVPSINPTPDSTRGIYSLGSTIKSDTFQDIPATPLFSVLTIDLELATAIRLSLLEAQEAAADDARKLEEIIEHLKSWDQEVERLANWSRAFEKSLTRETPENEVEKQFLIFEKLAKIGSTFASAVQLDDTSNLESLKPHLEQQLNSVVQAMSKFSGKTLDVKIDFAQKTPKDVLHALKQANDDIMNL